MIATLKRVIANKRRHTLKHYHETIFIIRIPQIAFMIPTRPSSEPYHYSVSEITAPTTSKLATKKKVSK